MRRGQLCLLSVGIGISLAACSATAPEARIDSELEFAPSSWSARKEANTPVDHDWVKSFGDASLSKLVNEALAKNPDMTVAAERLVRAQIAANVAGAGGRPEVTLGASGNKQELGGMGFGRPESYGVDLNVGWEPDIWGRYRKEQSAAIADAQASQQQYRAARSSLAAQVCKAWFALAESNQQVKLAEEALKTYESTQSSIQDRFERDMQAEGGSASQLRLSQTDVATAKAELSARKSDREMAQRQLELIVGRYPAGKEQGKVKLPKVPKQVPAGLPSELLLRRPDIISAERQYAAAGARVREAELAVYPSFRLTGSSGFSSSELGNVINSDMGVWSLGIGVTQYLFSGGRILGEINSRRSVDREAAAQLHRTVLQGFAEVEQALAMEKWLAQRERDINEAFELAAEASQAAEDDFRDGNGDVLTLFLAQNRKIVLNTQVVSIRRLRLNNRVDLHLALGGGFYIK